MNVLVTGGTGFVGSHLVEQLVDRGDNVTALVRTPAKAGRLRELGVRMVAGDLHNQTALQDATARQDLIYHVAGLIAARSEPEFIRGNRDGTAALLQAAAQNGEPRFVLVSSLAAAGPAAPGHPLRGDEAPHPVTQYGRSKLAAERVVQEGPLRWSIVRPPTVYGPRDAEVLKIFKLARFGVAPVFGDGSQELSLVYGPDLAAALIAVGTAGAASEGKTFFACHPEIVTGGQLVRAIGANMGRRVRLIPVPRPIGRAVLAITGRTAALAGRTTILTSDKANEFFQPAWTADPAALTEATGWRAAHNMESGLAATCQWYRQSGWL